jgi:hypothetical protein
MTMAERILAAQWYRAVADYIRRCNGSKPNQGSTYRLNIERARFLEGSRDTCPGAESDHVNEPIEDDEE